MRVRIATMIFALGVAGCATSNGSRPMPSSQPVGQLGATPLPGAATAGAAKPATIDNTLAGLLSPVSDAALARLRASASRHPAGAHLEVLGGPVAGSTPQAGSSPPKNTGQDLGPATSAQPHRHAHGTAAHGGRPQPRAKTDVSYATERGAKARTGLPGSDPSKLTDDQVAKRVKDDVASLGSMSVGRTNGGTLVNGVQMPEGEYWQVMGPYLAWGTQETVDGLTRAITKVNHMLPPVEGDHAQPVVIGHISRQAGGKLYPHRSHQAGRDVDISYFHFGKALGPGFRKANSKNLDMPRTWAFIRTLIIDNDIKYIFMNSYVQRMLRKYAVSIGEDKAWLDTIFQTKSRHTAPLIRHAHGHDDHMHIRFISPKAQKMARRAYSGLVNGRMVPARMSYVKHRARKGDILKFLAKRYHTSIAAIQKANGLKDSAVKIGRTYLIPKPGKRTRVRPQAPVVIPPRRVPPSTPPLFAQGSVQGKGGVASARRRK